MTIGRNDPCPCGSGKKYKSCHLETAMADAAPSAPEAGLQAMEPALADVRDLFDGKRRRRGAVDEAQEIMYRAWETPDPARRIRLAGEALAVSPDCADAYVLLAEDDAATPEKRRTLLEAGVAAGERAIGKRAFERDAGHFWGILETRPYMRARQGLALCLWALADRLAAIGHLCELCG